MASSRLVFTQFHVVLINKIYENQVSKQLLLLFIIYREIKAGIKVVDENISTAWCKQANRDLRFFEEGTECRAIKSNVYFF